VSNRLRTPFRLVVTVTATVTLLAVGAMSVASAAVSHKGSPISIGVICSCTGPQASSFAVSDAAPLAWQAAVNAAGGIAGHPVKVIEKDDDSNPGTSLSLAEQLITQDHVVAVIDNTNVDAGWSTYAAQHHVPVLGVSFPSPAMATTTNYFPVGLTEGYLDDEIVLGAKKAGAKKLAMFYCAEQAVCAEEVSPLEAVGKQLGLPVVYDAAISASAPNYTAQCLVAKQSGAQALFIADAVSVNLSVASSCAEQGYKPIEVSDDGAVALSYKSAPTMQNMIAGEPDVPFFVHDTPATKAMWSAMRRYQPAALASPNFNEEVTQAWVACELLEAAVKAAGVTSRSPVTAAVVMKGLGDLHGDTLGGMAPPLTFPKGKVHTVSCWFWMRVQHHQFTTPYGLRTTCAPKS
jgi:branched-chain amino acid transport system substrate-binding protein